MKKTIYLTAMLFLFLPVIGFAGNVNNDKKVFLEVNYSAGSFDYVKESSNYGMGLTFLPWSLSGNSYMGFRFSPANLNYGFIPSDYASDTITLGPAIGFFFNDIVRLIIPLEVMCAVSFNENLPTKTTWGMSLSPAIYLGGKLGVYVGPKASLGFVDGSKPSFGFKAGFFF